MSDTSTEALNALRQRRLVRAERKVPASRHEPEPEHSPHRPVELATPPTARSTEAAAPTPQPIRPPVGGPHASGSAQATAPLGGGGSGVTEPRGAPLPGGAHPVVGANDPHVYLSARVRQSLQDHLSELLHQLRRAGVRSSKVELIEMLLWNLPAEPDPQLLSNLQAFRVAAPRDALGSLQSRAKP